MCEFHQSLTCCEAYPNATKHVDFIETHISRLYLTDDLVYKIKKPVDLGFCNFTSLDRRRFYCEEEIRLNKRLTSDCYLGLSKVVRQGDSYAIDQPGEVIEYAVRMRRLPRKRMLNHLLANPESSDLPALIKRIGYLLADFHRRAPRLNKSTHDLLRMMQVNWQQNFDQTRDCPPEMILRRVLNRLEPMILTFMQENAELFDRRQELDFVRDGHGDLHSEHICLSKPIQIFDCIEFNLDLRYGDILNDLAFLYMDLERRRRPDLAKRLWISYQSRINVGPRAESLIKFYSLYRAWVRAKIHHFQSQLPDSRIDHQLQAREYFQLASRYALPPMLLLCCGLIGSGKSTLARDLGTALQARVISSDLERTVSQPQRKNTQNDAQDRYSPESRLAIYAKLAARAATELLTGQTLIVDATFENQQMRSPFIELALRAKIASFFIETTCPDSLIRSRLLNRSADPRLCYGSEAGLQQFEQQRERFEPLPPDLLQLHVDTGQPREYNVDSVTEKLLQTCGTLS